MSQNPPPKDPQAPSSSQGDALPSEEEKKLEAIIEKGVERIPPEQFPGFLRDTLIAIIERGANPRVDPETLKIASATVEKDNENKFQYLMKKLDVDAQAKEADRSFEKDKYNSTVKLLWPILISAIILVLGCTGAGIYLAANGHETLGFSILSGTIAALFSYLGGLGTPRFWQS